LIEVSIIIVNYNTRELTLNCLSSIKKQTKNIEYEIIVVDNNSKDGSQEAISKRYPDVVLIKNNINNGFGKANNQGIKIAKGKYIFLLNSDTILLNNAIKIFYDWMEKNNEKNQIGAIGTILLNEKLKSNLSYGKFPKASDLLIKEFSFINKIFKKNYFEKVDNIQKGRTSFEVDYITGADLFVPKKVLDDVGVFDENFFMYYEETDLQFRMKQNNYLRKIINGPKIIHLESKSINIKLEKLKLLERSKILYLKKHEKNRLKLSLFKILYKFMRILKTLIRKDYNNKEKIDYIKFLLRL
jgi:hypothetical protein